MRAWCGQRGIGFRVRVLSELRREGTPRAEYEAKSREARYAAYRAALAACGGRGVLFGHHVGDVRENVLANVLKGGSALDLGGMRPVATIAGVPVWRPLLRREKAELYALARAYGVPWLRDSTPAWSTRGRTRNELVPLLASMYGAGHADHLSALAADCAQLRQLVHSALLQPFWSSAAVGPLCARVPCGPHAHRPPFWWKEALRVLCESRLGAGLVRERAIANLLAHLRRSPPHEGWLSLKRDNRALLFGGGQLAIFRGALFPLSSSAARSSEWVRSGAEWWCRKDRQLPEGARCVLRVGERAAFGPWAVELSREPRPPGGGAAALCLDEVLGGRFAYAVDDVGEEGQEGEAEGAETQGAYELCSGAAKRLLPPALLELDPTLRCALPNVVPCAPPCARRGAAAERGTVVVVRCAFDSTAVDRLRAAAGAESADVAEGDPAGSPQYYEEEEDDEACGCASSSLVARESS